MREPEAPGICFTASFIVPRQLRSIDGWIPSSVATCARGRPLDASSDTASRLNSSVNARRVVVFVVINAPRPFQELTRGVHSFGGGSLGEMFTVQRFMDMDALAERNVHQFDAWASAFGDTRTELELQASGLYK